jgi:hypothetical protein
MFERGKRQQQKDGLMCFHDPTTDAAGRDSLTRITFLR